jgi:hypothetical protein
MEKWKYSFLGLLILVSCAQVEHKGEVDVNLTLDFEELEKYFDPICRDELPPTATDEQIEACVNEKIGVLLEALIQISPT